MESYLQAPGSRAFGIPSNVVLTWPSPDYFHPVTRGHLEHWVLSAIFLFGASICLVTRLWSRIFVRRWIGLDDLLMLLGYACAVTVTVLVTIGTTRYDWDRHIWDMTPAHYQASMHILYFARIFWGSASSCIRLSVICLYYRLLKACQAPQRFFTVMHITTGFNLLIVIFYIFTGILPCIPIRAYWTYPLILDASCSNDAKAMEAAAIVNTFAEFQLALLPLIGVYLLRVRKSQRWPIISLLSLGFSVSFVGCFRTYYIWRAMKSYDPTWYAEPQWVCSEIENYLALMCTCAVPLRPFVRHTWRRFEKKPFSELSRTSAGSLTTSRNRSGDPNDAADWTSMMRKVDLEGIADDGYGYTVTISGPAAPERKGVRVWIRTMTANMLRPKERSQSSRNESQPLEMTMKTEIAVDESTHPLEKRI